jgi:hypothetical protein
VIGVQTRSVGGIRGGRRGTSDDLLLLRSRRPSRYHGDQQTGADAKKRKEKKKDYSKTSDFSAIRKGARR